jgi:FkbM family methyltransferase
MISKIDFIAWLGARIGKPPGFERLARFLAPPERCRSLGEVCMMRDGTLFVARPSTPVGWHIAFFGSYEPELRAIMRTVVPQGGVAIDVGANIGWHTLWLATLAGAEGRVLAIEANPSVRAELLRNLQINRLGQVDVFPCAAAEAEGTLSFFGPDVADVAAADGYVVRDPQGTPDLISVAARPLDAIIAEQGLTRLDFIKIDVEGFEWPVLQGAERSIAKHRPYVLFEFDSHYTARGGGSSSLLSDFFSRHHYEMFVIGRNWGDRLEAARWPDGYNILAVPVQIN